LPLNAQAAPIEIKGNAQACFGDGCTFADTTNATIGGVLLNYTSNSDVDFWGFTEDGVLSISGDLLDGESGNFGTISVSTPDVKTPVSTAFSLLLKFANPDSPNTTFEAALKGTVSTRLNGGGVNVTFDPSVVSQAFFDASTGEAGTMTITAYSFPILSGGSADLTGFVETVTTPEPATLLLMGAGFTGLLARRKKLLGQV